MTSKHALTLLLALGLSCAATAQELTRYQYDRAGNIVGIVVGPETEL